MKDTSAVATSLADRFQIMRELGAGGMATVYLARDRKHGREVALKVLRPELSADLGADRFLNEIRITAGLDHPHILTLIDSGASGEFLWYVLPYVRGESLRARLQREKQLGIEEALRITQQVAGALDYAHRQGVIHRDIKPENILLFEGEAMLTDFGIALAVTEAAGSRLTRTGLSLGTPQYMSPEQATGQREPDARSDVYSLGAVVYEMLAGEPPHSGATEQAVIARMLTERPTPLRTVRDTVPQALDQAVAKALARLPVDRFATAGAFSQAAAAAIASSIGSASEASQRRRLLLVGAGAIAVIGGLVWSVALARRGSNVEQLVLGKANQITAEAGLEVHPAISPDGKLVAYSAGGSQHMRIFIRPIAGGRTIPLLDDPGAVQSQPRWSPDGTRILFLDRDGALVAPALGGSARPLIPGRPERPVTTADWSPDGRQVAFVRADSLFVRGVDDGRERVVYVSHGEWLHSCAWSPRGEMIACIAGNWDFTRVGRRFGNLAPSQLLLIPAAGGPPIAVTDRTTLNQSPVWSRNGQLLYFVSNRQGPRDIYAVRISKGGHPAAKAIRMTTGLGAQSIGLTADGTRLIYSVYSARGNVWSLPIPLSGPVSIEGAVPITSGTQIVEGIRVSIDGRWLLYDSDLRGNSDIYRISLAGGESEQLTSDPVDEFAPDLSPDGKALAFHSFRTGSRDVVIRMLDGSAVEFVTETPSQESFPRWSPDGSALLIWDQTPFNKVSIVRRRPDGTWGTPILLVKELEFPSWSPDGRLVLGSTLRTKAVATIPAEGGELRTLYMPRPSSSDPLVERVEWSPDGRRVFFKSLDSMGRASLWVVPASGGRPRLLVRFDDPTRPSSRPDFATDGRRFYFTIEDRQSDIWVAEIAKR
ncbi:MAG TPA: protein kinase [Gemmatimonadaceae bacterium]|nr:protein kinase [Gemmatimonadaceae bacterium]